MSDRAFSKFARVALSLVLPLWLVLVPAAAHAQVCSSITSQNVRFSFDKAYACGQFASGDWWVVPDAAGGVTLTALSPSPYSSGCTPTQRDGWEVNPGVSSAQALDSRIRGTTYTPSRMPCLPYRASAGQSLVKTNSWNPTKADCWWTSNSTTETCLQDAAVLTVLATPPPADAFRPPYAGTAKPIYRTSELDLGLLPRLPKVTGTPTLAQARAMFGGPWLDHIEGWPGRAIHPSNNMRTLENTSDPADYGAEIARATGQAALRAMHDESNSEKLPLVVSLVQYGIDLYHQLPLGNLFLAFGGQGNGRKLPILFAGRLLGRPEFLAIGQTYKTWSQCGQVFSEDGSTYYGEGNVALFGDAGLCGCTGKFGGDPGYASWLSSGCSSGKSTCRDPRGLVDGGHVALQSSGGDVCRALRTPAAQITSGTYEASAYQYCCSSAPYIGTQMAALLVGVRAEWRHDAFFDYVDRWMRPPWNGGGWYDSSYFNAMYAAYRTCAPSCGSPDVTPPSPPVLLE